MAKKLFFVKERCKRPVRVDNEAKGCLENIALALSAQPDARLVIVAHGVSTDRPGAGPQRAVNAKQYLSHDKGIDASWIELRTGMQAGLTVDTSLVSLSSPQARRFPRTAPQWSTKAASNLRLRPRKQRRNRMA